MPQEHQPKLDHHSAIFARIVAKPVAYAAYHSYTGQDLQEQIHPTPRRPADASYALATLQLLAAGQALRRRPVLQLPGLPLLPSAATTISKVEMPYFPNNILIFPMINFRDFRQKAKFSILL